MLRLVRSIHIKKYKKGGKACCGFKGDLLCFSIFAVQCIEVVWWLALLPHSKKVVGLNPAWGLSVWSLYILFRHSSFLPQSKSMNEVQLILILK